MAALDSGAQVSVANLSGLFKERYADKLQDLVHYNSILAEDIKFSRQPKLGDSYHFPVRVQRAHGVTFNADGSAFELNAAKAGVTVDANVQGSEFVLRERIAYGAASRAVGSQDAFSSTFDTVVLDMSNSAAFYREMLLLYGQSDIGTAETSVVDSAVTHTITITQATWAPGLWAQMVGAKVDLYNSAGGTKQNSGDIEVLDVDLDNRTVTVRNVSADSTEVGNAGTSSYVFTPIGDYASSAFTVPAGLNKIMTNTTTLFGINAATYSIWKSASHAAGSAALTMAKLTAACAKSVVRSAPGLRRAYVPTAAWTDLNNDHAALRRFADSTKGGLDLGTSKITYHGPSGPIEVVPHTMVKSGEAFVVDPRHLKRIGSTDLTFELPGSIEGQQPRFFQELDSYAGFEIRCYWDQALISDRPGAHVKVTGITNNAAF